MEGFEVLGIAIIFFVAYLYIPTSLFRFGAEQLIDLGPRSDSTEVEAFITAAITSAPLHLVTFLIFKLLSVFPGIVVPAVDWHLVAAFLTSEDHAYVRDVLQDRVYLTSLYFFGVACVSILSGVMYATAFMDKLRGITWQNRIPPLPRISGHRWYAAGWNLARATPSLLWFATIELMYASMFKVANFFFHETVVPLFPYAVLQPTVAIRTRSNRLYFGRFHRYEKAGGKIDSITITDVVRYCYEEIDKAPSEGRLPMSEFVTPLTIQWEEVADIHEANPQHLQGLLSRYGKKKRLVLAETLLDQFDGRTMTFDHIRRSRRRNNSFSDDDVRSVLSDLLLDGVVEKTVGAPDAEFTFPARRLYTQINGPQDKNEYGEK